MKKQRLIIGLVLLLAGLMALGLFAPPNAKLQNPVLFEIQPGESLTAIANHLEEKKLIRSSSAFLLLAKFKKLSTQVQPGRYPIAQGASIFSLLHLFTDPDNSEISVTIPEGYAIADIDEKLARMGLIIPGEFHAAALGREGFLFPDTYAVLKYHFSPDDFDKKMENNFLKKMTPEFLREIKKQNKTLTEIITMASMLEKEAKTERDFALVSGILWKRLEHGWPLQVDATLLYGKSTTTITKNELTENSPYNTYQNRGLPPTPIGNPGTAAIRAAIFPENSSYWFYLSDREGQMHYARTNEEHNENRRQFLHEVG